MAQMMLGFLQVFSLMRGYWTFWVLTGSRRRRASVDELMLKAHGISAAA